MLCWQGAAAKSIQKAATSSSHFLSFKRACLTSYSGDCRHRGRTAFGARPAAASGTKRDAVAAPDNRSGGVPFTDTRPNLAKPPRCRCHSRRATSHVGSHPHVSPPLTWRTRGSTPASHAPVLNFPSPLNASSSLPSACPSACPCLLLNMSAGYLDAPQPVGAPRRKGIMVVVTASWSVRSSTVHGPSRFSCPMYLAPKLRPRPSPSLSSHAAAAAAAAGARL
jgi:hypothetical protein